ncbi:pre-peptidase c family protein [Leptolyngbya sp. Heron Island J]|uniref:pre-peptidase C-terminal domain-containing protein n=1 Tax=Leptolyngbya sp. Heron Island J TaxID=1385935 RepID=UPI0003B9BBE0|nr:pre-peptidase C-terminal domain-containing protein [Leptolyngbya sp. Heron Island J]ESA37247.1 pre-peptidase c family protein [Leptolyngbya sp. Heron Island J]
MPSFSLLSLMGRQMHYRPNSGFAKFAIVAQLTFMGTVLGLWSPMAAPAAAQALLEEQVEFQPQQDTYTFTGEAGDAVIIEMVSEEFDTFITLMNPAGEILEQNDDYNGTPQATIVMELPETGEYTLLAGSFYGQLGGTYQVTVKPATDYQLVYDRALELMQSEDYGEAAEAYTAAIVLRADDPNAYLGKADALLRQQALILGETFRGPNDLPAEIRSEIVVNYEKAAQLYTATGEEEFAQLIREQAEFVRSGQAPER